MKNKKILYAIDRILDDYNSEIQSIFSEKFLMSKKINKNGVLVNKKNLFIGKLITKLNFEKILKKLVKKYYKTKINEHENFDILFSLGGECFSKEVIDEIRKKNPNIKTVKFLWDKTNFEYIEAAKKKYDEIYTFEKEDAKKYNLKFRSSFYLDSEYYLNDEKKIDCYYLGALREERRYRFINKFYNYCQKNSLNSKLELFIKNKKIKKEFTNKDILTNEWRSYKENVENVKLSKVVIELNYFDQKGLTLRTFECIGAKSKLITENRDILNYDFYCPENIYVLSSIHDIDKIPQEFFKKPYKELPLEIRKKYSLEGFIEEIF